MSVRAAARYDDLEREIFRLRASGATPEAERELVIEQARIWPDLTDEEQDERWRRLGPPPEDLGLVDVPPEIHGAAVPPVVRVRRKEA